MGVLVGALSVGIWAIALHFGSGGAVAQEAGDQAALRSPVLVLDFDRLLTISDMGRAMQQAQQRRRRALAEEIERIDAQMAAEELRLTNRRDSLSPAEFRELADEFDATVEAARREQDTKARELARREAEDIQRFRESILPVLGRLMLETGAVVVMDKTQVEMFNDAIDVTERLAERIDSATGDDASRPSGSDDGESSPVPEAPELP